MAVIFFTLFYRWHFQQYLAVLFKYNLTLSFNSYIKTLISNGSTIQEILYCAEVNALNFERLPIFNLSGMYAKARPSHLIFLDPRLLEVDGSQFPRATLAKVKPVNYFSLANAFTSGGPVVSFAKDSACVYWFGRDYPFDAIYSQDPQVLKKHDEQNP